MKLTHIFQAGAGFRVLETTERSQTGLLTLESGEASSHASSVHEQSDQVLLVLRGEVIAEIDDESELKRGDAVVVPAKTPHRFVNHGPDGAVTFSVYAPPAFPPNETST